MSKQWIITVVLVLIVGAASFWGGMQYQRSRRNFNGQGFQGQFRGANGQQINNRPVSGQITSSDDKGMTVKAQDGSSRIILFSDKTVITKGDAATKQDLQIGKEVLVTGTNNSDGSVTANNIQINPLFGGMRLNQ